MAAHSYGLMFRLLCLLSFLLTFYAHGGEAQTCAPPTGLKRADGTCVSSCPVGTYISGTNCVPCSAGTYQNVANSTTCKTCPNGQGPTTPTGGSSSCTACTYGYYSNATTSYTCQMCPAGFIQAALGGATCTPCSAGYQANTARTACVACGYGFYGPNGVGCFSCPNNTYSAYTATAPSQCLLCSAGNEANAAKTGCQGCAPGFYSSSATNFTCQPCPTGTAIGSYYQSACTRCTAGTQPNAGRTACVSCNYGMYGTDGINCYQCPNNTYAAGGSTSCTLCPAGQKPTANQYTCETCPLGSFSNNATNFTCQFCPPGTVSWNYYATSCTRCANTQRPRSDRVVCESCPAGTYGVNGTECFDCPNGTYSAAGAVNCSFCTAGQGATAVRTGCAWCGAGTYSNSTTNFTCTTCPDGSVTTSYGLTKCTVCTPGTAPNTGRTSCDICQYAMASPNGMTCQACPVPMIAPLGSPNCSFCRAGQGPNYYRGGCDICPAGKYSNATTNFTCASCPAGAVAIAGSANCTFCQPGTMLSADNGTCTVCAAGYYGPDGLKCAMCPANQWSLANSSSCSYCSPGYQSYARTLCTACSPGYYSSSATNFTCAYCPAGTIAPGYNNTQCKKCSAGQTDSGRISCILCPAYYYSNAATNFTCVYCAQAFTTGSTTCKCNPGWYTGATATTCTLCPAGTYSSDGLSCVQCPIGTSTNWQIGRVNCTACTAGTFSPQDRQYCQSCPAGTTSNGTVCNLCPLGYSTSVYPGATSCTKCSAGYYAPANRVNCLGCPAGTYSPNGTECLPCPDGYSTNGATARAVCTPCAAGTYPLNGYCQPCPAGKNNTDGKVCQLCPEGQSTQGQIGRVNCTKCAGGYYSRPDRFYCTACPAGTNGTDGLTCPMCPNGTYNYYAGSATCNRCPNGHFSSPDRTRCVPCPGGTYGPNGKDCVRCPIGRTTQYITGNGYSSWWAVATGMTTCQQLCLPGYEAAPDRTLCRLCRPGTFSTNGTECIPCPALQSTNGWYGQSRCYNCTAGYVTSYANPGTCTACPPGTFFGNATYCMPCPAGTYQPYYARTSQAQCLPCPLGRYCPKLGVSAGTVCPAGRFANVTGLAQCYPCREGMYQPYTGQTSCLKCPASTPVSVGGRRCASSACPNGTTQATPLLCVECEGDGFKSNTTGECIECPEGYSELDGECQADDFEDQDECVLGVHRCSGNSTCTNTMGSYKCACAQGLYDYYGDGTKCTAAAAGLCQGYTTGVADQQEMHGLLAKYYPQSGYDPDNLPSPTATHFDRIEPGAFKNTPASLLGTAIGEVGTISIGSRSWITVKLKRRYPNPVVVLTPGSMVAIPRTYQPVVGEVTSDSFTVRLVGDKCVPSTSQNDTNVYSISYMVMTEGQYYLPVARDNTTYQRVVVGMAPLLASMTNQVNHTVRLPPLFASKMKPPAVLLQVQDGDEDGALFNPRFVHPNTLEGRTTIILDSNINATRIKRVGYIIIESGPSQFWGSQKIFNGHSNFSSSQIYFSFPANTFLGPKAPLIFTTESSAVALDFALMRIISQNTGFYGYYREDQCEDAEVVHVNSPTSIFGIQTTNDTFLRFPGFNISAAQAALVESELGVFAKQQPMYVEYTGRLVCPCTGTYELRLRGTTARTQVYLDGELGLDTGVSGMDYGSLSCEANTTTNLRIAHFEEQGPYGCTKAQSSSVVHFVRNGPMTTGRLRTMQSYWYGYWYTPEQLADYTVAQYMPDSDANNDLSVVSSGNQLSIQGNYGTKNTPIVDKFTLAPATGTLLPRTIRFYKEASAHPGYRSEIASYKFEWTLNIPVTVRVAKPGSLLSGPGGSRIPDSSPLTNGTTLYSAMIESSPGSHWWIEFGYSLQAIPKPITITVTRSNPLNGPGNPWLREETMWEMSGADKWTCAMPPADGTFSLEWKVPESNDFYGLSNTYLLPGYAGQPLIFRDNIVASGPTLEERAIEVVLSSPPKSNVTLQVLNPVASDLIGFATCNITFTPTNWETPQSVITAPLASTGYRERIEGNVLVYMKTASDQESFDGRVASAQFVSPAAMSGGIAPPPSVGIQPGGGWVVKKYKNWGVCSSTNDPNMRTFDVSYFGFHGYPGAATPWWYLLRDRTSNFVVQAKITTCAGLSAKCNKVIVVKYNTTVIAIMPTAYTATFLYPSYYYLNKGNNGVKVNLRKGRAMVLEVALPSGARVQAMNYKKSLTVVLVVPKGPYYKCITGICGNFDDIADTTNPQKINAANAVPAGQVLITNPLAVLPPNTATVKSECPPDVPRYLGCSPPGYKPVVESVNTAKNGSNSTSQVPVTVWEDLVPPMTPADFQAEWAKIVNASQNQSYLPVNPDGSYIIPNATDAQTEACQSLINQALCPSMPAASVLAHQTLCIETMALMGQIPGEEEALPFLEECSLLEGEEACSQCDLSQQCQDGKCLGAPECPLGCGSKLNKCVKGACVCSDPFYGEFCEFSRSNNSCVPNPCDNGGTCTSAGSGGYTCTCLSPFSGNNCEDVDECALGTHDCHPDATCSNTKDAYDCQCKPGFLGDGSNCTALCKSDPPYCLNGGQCTMVTVNVPLVGAMSAPNCTCDPIYSGSRCEIVPAASLGNLMGFLWVDVNEDGKFDNGTETVLSNARINLFRDGEIIRQNFTNGFGYYYFPSLRPGNYHVEALKSSFPPSRTLDIPIMTLTANRIASIPWARYNQSAKVVVWFNQSMVPAVGQGPYDKTAQDYILSSFIQWLASVGSTAMDDAYSTKWSGINKTAIAISDMKEYLKRNTEWTPPVITETDRNGVGSTSLNQLKNQWKQGNFTGLKVRRQAATDTTANTTTTNTTSTDPAAQGPPYTGVLARDATIQSGTTTEVQMNVTIEINPCTDGSVVCAADAICLITNPTATCECNAGYTGNGNITCVDLDECSSKTHKCDVAALCSNTIGSYSCGCNSGYVGNGTECTTTDPTNPCGTGTHSCDPVATCTFTPSNITTTEGNNTVTVNRTFTCTCNAGYEGNGDTCSAPSNTSTVSSSSASSPSTTGSSAATTTDSTATSVGTGAPSTTTTDTSAPGAAASSTTDSSSAQGATTTTAGAAPVPTATDTTTSAPSAPAAQAATTDSSTGAAPAPTTTDSSTGAAPAPTTTDSSTGAAPAPTTTDSSTGAAPAPTTTATSANAPPAAAQTTTTDSSYGATGTSSASNTGAAATTTTTDSSTTAPGAPAAQTSGSGSGSSTGGAAGPTTGLQQTTWPAMNLSGIFYDSTCCRRKAMGDMVPRSYALKFFNLQCSTYNCAAEGGSPKAGAVSVCPNTGCKFDMCCTARTCEGENFACPAGKMWNPLPCPLAGCNSAHCCIDRVSCDNRAYQLANGDFEYPTVNAIHPQSELVTVASGKMVGWKTTDSSFEMYKSDPNGVQANQGSQFAEINSQIDGELSQTIQTVPGDTLVLQFSHLGRGASDTLEVFIGPVGGNITSVGQFSNSNAQWKRNSATYLVPSGANQVVVKFKALSGPSNCGGKTCGNYIDSVSIHPTRCNAEFTLLPCGSSVHELTNGDFETPAVVRTSTSQPVGSYVPAVEGWSTTEAAFELWQSGYNGVEAARGNQLIELNANAVGALSQDIYEIPGDEITVAFSHRGRDGTDTMKVLIGSKGNANITLGEFSTGNSGWKRYSVRYVVPEGMRNLTLSFVAVSSASATLASGNLIDAVSVMPSRCVVAPSIAHCSNNTYQFGNGDFEQPSIQAANEYYQFNPSWVPSWKTTGSVIELWKDTRVPAAKGKQFAEVNGVEDGALYQVINTIPGDEIAISFSHRGRDGTDTVELFAGPDGAPLTSFVTSLGRFVTANDQWVRYTTYYVVPPGQTRTGVRFKAVATGSNACGIACGNFIDDVVIRPKQCP